MSRRLLSRSFRADRGNRANGRAACGASVPSALESVHRFQEVRRSSADNVCDCFACRSQLLVDLQLPDGFRELETNVCYSGWFINARVSVTCEHLSAVIV